MAIKFASVTELGDVKTKKADFGPFIEDGNELSSLICSLLKSSGPDMIPNTADDILSKYRVKCPFTIWGNLHI
jgi:hypothetical protein